MDFIIPFINHTIAIKMMSYINTKKINVQHDFVCVTNKINVKFGLAFR